MSGKSYFLGYDVGSSSVKVAIVEAETKETLAITNYPKTEMEMNAPKPGWAEQHPEDWWNNLKEATKEILEMTKVEPSSIQAIGVSYQMHGLVLIDKDQKVLRPAIIWSDSRAVKIGEESLERIGENKCYAHMLNSPGNFTASKLKWVIDNEPEIAQKADKFLLPGDYIAMKMTGNVTTTIQGLSEGVFWDFKEKKVSEFLLNDLGIGQELVPEIGSSIGEAGTLSAESAKELGLTEGISIAYRGGDQPNNAMSLNVIKPGEVAASGGTSGVVYAVVDKPLYDPKSRVNGFAHVNHTNENESVGILLCINGSGSQYSWIKNQVAKDNESYYDMEELASKIPIGSDGLRIMPFGNGAERMLENSETGSQVINLQFNIHKREHLYRAALEGIAFSFVYGMELLKNMKIPLSIMRVGDDNLFRSGIFSSTIATLIGCEIEVIHTTGAAGAAKAAGFGIGYYPSLEAALTGNKIVNKYMPDNDLLNKYQSAYDLWKNDLNNFLKK